MNEPGLTQITLLQIPVKVPPEDPGILEIIALLLYMPPEQVMWSLLAHMLCLMQVAAFPHGHIYP